MKRLVCVALLAAGCGPNVRTYDVQVDAEQYCRTLGDAPESCAATGTPAVRMQVTIEDRGDGKAIIYGRSDNSDERTYLATVPRAGRYEVVERTEASDTATECSTVREVVVALDVTDSGLEGGEETRSEETRGCNELEQRQVNRRLRDWNGSRAQGDG